MSVQLEPYPDVSWWHYLRNMPSLYRCSHSRDFVDMNPDLPVYATVLYLLAVFYLPGHLAKHKKVYKLKWVVAGWNLFLSIFSALGAYYGVMFVRDFVFGHFNFYSVVCKIPDAPADDPLLRYVRHIHHASRDVTNNDYFERMSQNPQKYSQLHRKYYDYGPYCFYMAAFTYLKAPELLDTVFLILQGKPVSFLHWYHHIVTFIFCWHSGYTLYQAGVLFAVMNYCVHSIMYFYYFLVMMGLRMKIRPFAPCITVLQCLQMFIGMGITVYTYLQHWLGPNKQTTYFYNVSRPICAVVHYSFCQCAHYLKFESLPNKESVPAFHMEDYFYGCRADTTGMRMGMMMYGSYCVLFVVLFKELYLDKRVKKRSLVLARKEQAKRELERSRKLGESKKLLIISMENGEKF